MRVSQTKVLRRETDPESPERYSGCPNMIQCPDGTLLLTERVGSEKNSADGTQRFWRSGDGGRSWTREPFPYLTTPHGEPGELRTAHFSIIGENRMGMLLTWMERPPEIPTILNPKTEGLLPIHIAWAESPDSGRTWSALRPIDTGQFTHPCGNGGLLRLADGSLLAGFETYKPYDDPSPWSARSAIVQSYDDGRSWSSPRLLAADPSHQICYWDHHPVILKDGTLLDLLWCDDRREPGVSHIVRLASYDGGRSWTAPTRVGISGQFSTIVQLPDERLLMFYVVRTGDPSIRARLGNADGSQWDDRDVMVLYSQATDDLNASRGKDFVEYLKTMGAWTFGWPTAVRVSDREVVVAYYQAEGAFSAIRVAHVEI